MKRRLRVSFLFFACVPLSLFLGVLYTQFAPKYYRSTATIKLFARGEATLPADIQKFYSNTVFSDEVFGRLCHMLQEQGADAELFQHRATRALPAALSNRIEILAVAAEPATLQLHVTSRNADASAWAANYLARQSQTRLQTDTRDSQPTVSILEEAVPARVYASPNLPLTFSLFALISILFGSAGAILFVHAIRDHAITQNRPA